MLDRDTGRPRGFGFVTFAEQRAMENAIDQLHGRELNGRVISVNRAQPKMGDRDDYGYGGGYPPSGRGGSGYGGGGPPPDRGVGRSDCFKCGRPGHWARECPVGGGGGARFSSRPRFSGGRGDRFGGGDRYGDDRYDGGSRFADRDRDRMDGRDGGRYAGRDRYGGGGDRFADRYNGGSDRYAPNSYGGKERGGYERESGRGGDRYGGGGPARYEGSYRERPGPYDRPPRGRPSSYDDRY
ncbi:glycine-rich RNA-binding protein RZ1C isoform X2 [Amborella trichopoda]|uniref:CCHC-type domain-containing protein n=2 Tax=Amborella trichopoda TaxID=13333 RepID=W1P153_AMBTC|nr:glycine-rich RNA-binding protein RZ1C isoform X2 [Amborella trichopoda]ERN01281.1 hypothetical protein AMTR_s00002p00251200 [Amborella trichopoda]|eukprot:XP_020519872.1 glycine-rich RNA-binding protein RZ1C isoform X2 [Amborella trichopoda]